MVERRVSYRKVANSWFDSGNGPWEKHFTRIFRWEWSLTKGFQIEPKVLCVDVVWQTQSAWFIRTMTGFPEADLTLIVVWVFFRHKFGVFENSFQFFKTFLLIFRKHTEFDRMNLGGLKTFFLLFGFHLCLERFCSMCRPKTVTRGFV